MARTYQGYVRADQSLLEEDENRGTSDDDDLEAGQARSHIFQDPTTNPKTRKGRHVSWRPGAAEMSILHPNIHREDKNHEHESSDDEVPQSFMVEASSRKPTAKGKALETVLRSTPSTSPRQTLNPLPGKSVTPVLHTTSLPPVSEPPRPSEPNLGSENTPRLSKSNATNNSHGERQPKPMRGLDAYERALWNWVNVYNLDAFLQEAYYYYEGKGIYSIALARGLNLLWAISSLCLEVDCGSPDFLPTLGQLAL
jgi:autophagy-related protein 9